MLADNITEFNEILPFMESLKEAISSNMNNIEFLTIFHKLYKNEEENNLTKLSILRVYHLYLNK